MAGTVRAVVQASPSAGIVRFGTFELDVRAGELRKGGARVRIQEQPLRVLQTLLEHPGQVVTRDELRRVLWAEGSHVDAERSLTKALVKLRDALGDDADSPRFVETLPRHGYRFIAPLTPETVPSGSDSPPSDRPVTVAAPPPRARGWRAIALATAGVVAASGIVLALLHHGSTNRRIASIAVLPLKNLSGDPAQDYFAEGLTEELTTDLARIQSLRVTSRTSTAQYAHTEKPLAAVARDLNVDAVLEGSMVVSRGRVRVTAQLVDARSDTHLWAQSYERDLGEVLDLQDSIALEIAARVKAELTREEQARLSAHRPIKPEAYEAYLRGRNELTKQWPDAIKSSVQYFQQALDLEPLYAPAYAGLADSFGLMANYSVLAPRAAFPRAEVAARRALDLDPTLAEGHVALALALHHYDWDWTGAEAEYRRALELSPGLALVHLRYAEFLSNDGRHDEALREMARAQELDPLSLTIGANVGRFLFYARRYDEAIRRLEQTLTIAPSRFFARVHLAMAFEQEGRISESLAEFERLSKASGNLGVGAAHALASAGRPDEARRILRRLEGPGEVQDWFSIAGVHAGLGDTDEAFAWLDRAIENRDFFVTYLKVCPYLDPLRQDPRFAVVLGKVGLAQR